MQKRSLNSKCVFGFSIESLTETFLIIRKIQRGIINVEKSSCQILTKTEIFSRDFRKILKHQVSWKSVQWEPSCSTRPTGRTNRHDEANSHFSQFCERVFKSIHFWDSYERMHSNVAWDGVLTSTKQPETAHSLQLCYQPKTPQHILYNVVTNRKHYDTSFTTLLSTEKFRLWAVISKKTNTSVHCIEMTYSRNSW
jgi:hypothetical protein